MKKEGLFPFWFSLCSLLLVANPIFAQSTAFTYQGRLAAAGTPASGNYDLTFSLFNTSTNGVALGNALTNLNVGVTDGLFTATLDFGAGFLTGSNLWLEVGVRTNGGGGFTLLTPRQQITPAPYALTAASVIGPVASGSLAGNYSNAVTFSNAANIFNGIFNGNGASLLNLNAGNLTSGIVPLSRLSGVSSNEMDPATDFAYRHPRITNTVSVINVRDYGATGQGDDSVAIKAAFTQWLRVGGVLYFPAGYYYDTNTYSIGPDAPGGYDGTLYYPLAIRGDNRGASFWMARITNATFITVNFYMPEVSDITIENAGSGTNTGLYTVVGGPVNWYNFRFRKWTWIGADMQGIAGGGIYGGSFEDNRIGLRVPGYCDGWVGDTRIDRNSLAGIEIGGVAPSYTGVKGSAAGRWHVTGAGNYIAVIVGKTFGGQSISGYIEGSTNCTVAIGNPPESVDHDLPNDIGPVTIENLGVLNYDKEVLVRLYEPPLMLMLHNVLGGSTNVVSTSALCDASPVIFEGAVASVANMLFSDGTTVPSNWSSYTTVNVETRRYNKSKLVYDATPDNNIFVNGSLNVGGSITATNQSVGGAQVFSGTGSPLNVIAAPIGSLYLRKDGNVGSTLYVKESGTNSTGWTAK